MATAPNEAQLTTKRAKTLSSAALASAAVATASTDDASDVFTLRAENAQQREEIEVFATMVATTEVSKIVYKILYCHTLLSL